MKMSIVIPAYNEGDNVRATIEELFKTLGRLPDVDETEIVVVDDHSSDDTFNTVRRMDEPRITCLRLSRRCGSHVALRAGIAHVKGDAVLCLSADGQDDPSCIAQMLSKWRNGRGVIWALRKDRKDEPWYVRHFARAFYRIALWLFGAKYLNVDLSRADFFLLDRKVVDAINNCPERNTSLFGLIVWLGFSQDWVDYRRRPRRTGRSKWNFRSRSSFAKDWVVGFFKFPLSAILLTGLLVAGVGFLWAVFLAINFVSGKEQRSLSFVMAGILILNGMQMAMLGILGEYLWNNLNETRRRPLFVIEKQSAGQQFKHE